MENERKITKGGKGNGRGGKPLGAIEKFKVIMAVGHMHSFPASSMAKLLLPSKPDLERDPQQQPIEWP